MSMICRLRAPGAGAGAETDETDIGALDRDRPPEETGVVV
jgi:hypothetical protein